MNDIKMYSYIKILNFFQVLYTCLNFIFFVGLVVDQFSQRLFWADFELSVIGSVLFDGSDSVVSVSTKQGMESFYITWFLFYFIWLKFHYSEKLSKEKPVIIT